MNQPYPPFRVPFVSGSDTSQEAAESMIEDLGRLEAVVLGFIRAQGSSGATDDEVEYNCKLTHQCASARRRTLVLKGYLRDSGLRRVTRQNRRAAVWVIGQEEPRTPSLPAKVPSKSQISSALAQIQKAVNLAKTHGFEPDDDLRAVWMWLQLQVGS